MDDTNGTPTEVTITMTERQLLDECVAERDAARASEARMREALGKIREAVEKHISCADPTDDCCGSLECGACVVDGLALDALSTPADDWLAKTIVDAIQRFTEELEARLCPEDVGLDEYIRCLLKRVEKAEAERDGLAAETKHETDRAESFVAAICDASWKITKLEFVPNSGVSHNAALAATHEIAKAISDPLSILAARDTRITAEARKAVLLEVIGAARSEASVGEFFQWLEKQAQEADHA